MYKVELDHTIGGNVKVTPALPEDGMAAENTELTFTADPLGGYRLEKWELDGTEVNGTALTYTLKVTANAQVFVFFKRNSAPPPAMHTVTLTEPEHGSVDTVPVIPPGHHKVPEGTELIFRAEPDAGYAVDKWTVSSGSFLAGGTDGSTSATLKITEAVTVTVTFKQVLCKIDFGVDGGHGTLKAEVDGAEITSGDTVEQGKTVTLTAEADPNYAVEKWTNNGTVITGAGTNTTYNHTVTADANIKVKFKYSGPALAVNQQTFTGTVGDTLPVYKLVTAGSGDYTATPENPSVISVNLNNATGNVTVQCTGEGSSRIKVKDNMSGQEAYSGTVTVQALVTVPDDFTAGGIHYRVVDKTNKHVHINYNYDDDFGATVHIPATVVFNGETYAITGCTKYCLELEFWQTAAFTVDSASAFLSAENGVLFNKDKTRLIKYPTKKTDTSYTVPDSVKIIGTSAFYEIHYNLTTLNLPEGKALTTIEDNGIYGCTRLANVNIPSTLRNLGVGFLFGSKITSAVIPEGVKSLEFASFSWCPNLTRVEFPASFKKSSDVILYGCEALTEVTCKALTPPSVRGFHNDTPLASCTLKVPAASISAYENAPIWKNFKKPFVGF
ncbi:leucine-rich repeat domain-containing protein [Treponema socranskii subsp. buccale]|uniref:leucine-rich repeat domain-containing protein n=1 Tax=Treponema socranskii TaxID=53419 RepID=UPI0020A419A9|nr:leucine-rich repeat domain-containing protein [Treponema socranskii]UTD03850.1 leucine-rich repeat domain-containing protein [Treponema socranskii subsp. buccale]